MNNNYEKCLETILHHEGGYVNHPADPGGMTNLGVTKRVYEEWVGREVDEAEMRALTPEDVAPLYKKNYWDKVFGDELPEGLDLCMFDFAVNAGKSRSVKFIQNVVGTVADGGMGPNTMKKINEYVDTNGIEQTIKEFQKERQNYYQLLDTFETFGRGWTRRVDETTNLALEMV